MKKLIFLLLIILVAGSCGKSKFKRSTFLQNLYDFKIEPEINSAFARSTNFSSAWENYMLTPSIEKLDLCKAEFTDALSEIDNIQFYNLGEISETYIYNKFNKTNIDTSLMWDFYGTHSIITSSDISGLPNNQKGIYAIEYLMFGEHAADSLSQIKYQNWLKYYILDLKENLSTLETSWNVYEKNFTANLDDGVEGSFNIVCNRIIHVLEDLIDKRLNPVITTSDASKGVGHYSENSLNSVKTQVHVLNEVFIGSGSTGTFNSVYNYLHKKKKKLADEVKEDFEAIISYQNQLSYTMEWYVANDLNAIIFYKELLKDLLVKFKLDVATAMGIVLTFGDSDGD